MIKNGCHLLGVLIIVSLITVPSIGNPVVVKNDVYDPPKPKIYIDIFVDFELNGNIDIEIEMSLLLLIYTDGSSDFDGVLGEFHGEDTLSLHFKPLTLTVDDELERAEGVSAAVVVIDAASPDDNSSLV